MANAGTGQHPDPDPNPDPKPHIPTPHIPAPHTLHAPCLSSATHSITGTAAFAVCHHRPKENIGDA
ncbi:MAG: hypothetical protein ACK559_07320, partial [bacterium]